MGRDERFAEMRRQRQMQSQAAQRSQLLGSIPSMQADPTDRFGVPIRVGDLVMYRPAVDPVFQVVDVKPVLAPNAPPGMIVLTLAIQMPVYAQVHQPVQNMVVWGNVSSAEEAPPPDAVITKVPEEPIAQQTPSNIESPKRHTSALPCGCDADAGWTCEEHRVVKHEPSAITLTD